MAFEWLATDKKQHIAACLIIALSAYQSCLCLTRIGLHRRWARVFTAILVSVAAGVLKELLDYTQWFWYGDPSYMDFGADLLGTAIAVIVIMLLETFGWVEYTRHHRRRWVSFMRATRSLRRQEGSTYIGDDAEAVSLQPTRENIFQPEVPPNNRDHEEIEDVKSHLV
eukprot:jgi/Bigna1/89279/estExt_fgenesh1_pg.C_460095